MINRLLFCLLFVFCPFITWAQDIVNDSQDVVADPAIPFEVVMRINDRIDGFIDELQTLETMLQGASQKRLAHFERQVKSVDIRWNAYYQVQQANIASDEMLLDKMAVYQDIFQSLSDTIVVLGELAQHRQNFSDADRYLSAQGGKYERMQKQAEKYMSIERMSVKLEQIKAREQLAFAEIQKYYDQAKSAVEACPELGSRMQKIEDHYVELKTMSDAIQAAEYKPFIERAKDYLMGIAAVALVLMLINMVRTRLDGVKAARENATKLEEMRKKMEGDLPTI